mgnify:CR=1 FL=1
MAYFNCPLSTSSPDMKKVTNYLRLLNQQLQYCFTDISPEDNFSEESFLKYQETETSIAQLEITMQGFLSQFQDLENEVSSSIKVLNGEIELKVSKGDLCSEISATADTIELKTGYITIETQNFHLLKDGTATFSGIINGGSININDRFVVSSTGSVQVESTTFSKQITTNGLLYSNYMRISGEANIEGPLNCRELYVQGDVSCETLYMRSDERLKEGIEDIDPDMALKVVLGLNPVEFEFIGSGERQIGFIAQEVQDLQQRAGTDLPLVKDGEYLSIPYANYTALLAGAVQAQQKEIERLEQILKEAE